MWTGKAHRGEPPSRGPTWDPMLFPRHHTYILRSHTGVCMCTRAFLSSPRHTFSSTISCECFRPSMLETSMWLLLYLASQAPVHMSLSFHDPLCRLTFMYTHTHTLASEVSMHPPYVCLPTPQPLSAPRPALSFPICLGAAWQDMG